MALMRVEEYKMEIVKFADIPVTIDGKVNPEFITKFYDLSRQNIGNTVGLEVINEDSVITDDDSLRYIMDAFDHVESKCTFNDVISLTNLSELCQLYKNRITNQHEHTLEYYDRVLSCFKQFNHIAWYKIEHIAFAYLCGLEYHDMSAMLHKIFN